MEKFEINENGTLTAYHNDDKDVTEITVPEGVKFIDRFVFSKYSKIYYVILPNTLESIDRWAFWDCFYNSAQMTYCGVNFNPALESFRIKEAIEMIAQKDYSKVLHHKFKFPIVIQIYFKDGDDVTTAYIKKNFKKFFVFLINAIIFQNAYRSCLPVESALEIMKKLISCGKFITKRNINTYIKYADEHECYEVFDMLEEYKEKNNF